ncbi:DUF815 domain-containing protein [Oscillospiraceae bacterium HV4-5-C5C]|nr:DUF815 domain-containing protein [Oscillospiraceae bacterium HV4-5-C5C]
MRPSPFQSAQAWRRLAVSLDCLTVYRPLTELAVVKQLRLMLRQLAELLSEGEARPEQSRDQALASIALLKQTSAFYADLLQEEPSGSWPAWLVHQLLLQENPFTRYLAAETQISGPVGQADPYTSAVLADQALADLSALQDLAQIDLGDIRLQLRQLLIASDQEWLLPLLQRLPEPDSARLLPTPAVNAGILPEASDLQQQLLSTLSLPGAWAAALRQLQQFHRTQGAGLTACYPALSLRHGQLEPLRRELPDAAFDLLYDYSGNLSRLDQTIAGFVRGDFAHDVLLTGPRGSGKSSAVRAVLPRYAGQGLRLIEVSPETMDQLHTWLPRLSRQTQHFILLFDDLSFSDAGAEYHQLKRLLEGGLTERGSNILICATSNRRHLLAESGDPESSARFADDERDERLSLADRFGLHLTFRQPLQTEYLAIIRHLALARGFAGSMEQLQQEALVWSNRRASRSPRVARQFIDDRLGKRQGSAASSPEARP